MLLKALLMGCRTLRVAARRLLAAAVIAIMAASLASGEGTPKKTNSFVSGFYSVTSSGGANGISLNGDSGTVTFNVGANNLATLTISTKRVKRTANETCLVNTGGCRESSATTGTAVDDSGATQIITLLGTANLSVGDGSTPPILDFSGTLTVPSTNQTGTVRFTGPLVTSTQSQGKTPFAAAFVEPVSGLTGELYDSEPDDIAPGGPTQLRFRRNQGSLLAANGIASALGANWMHNFDVRASVTVVQTGVTVFGGDVIWFLASGSNWIPFYANRVDYQLINTADGGLQFLNPAENLIYTFTSKGVLTAITDRNGNILAVTQGTNGPTQVSDGLGRTLTFAYQADGKLSQVKDQSGRAVSFAYTSGILTSVTDVAGRVTSHSITSAGTLTGLISKTTRPGGNTAFTQTYDATGRVVSQADGRGNSYAMVYSSSPFGDASIRDPLGNVTTVSHPNLRDLTRSVDSNGNATVSAYDANDRPVSIVDRNGNTRRIAYHDPSGYPASLTDAAGNQTTFTYTASSVRGFTFYDRTGVGYADGTTESFAYDANGNQIKFTDRAGKATTFTYNSRGQVLTQTNALGGVTTLTYNSDGTIATLKTPSGDTTTYAYDTLKRLSQIKLPDGATRAFSYDAFDRVTQATDERSKVTKTSFTDNGKLQSVTDSLGAVTSLTYDAAENVATLKTPAGTTSLTYNGVNLPSSIASPTGEAFNFGYDKLNQAASISDRAGPVASLTYDNEGALNSITDGAGRIFKIARDALGRATQLTAPSGASTRQTFDTLGRLSSLIDALGAVITLTYEARGRISGLALPEGIQSSYRYDDLGNLTSFTDPDGNIWNFTYDAQGRLTSRKDPLGRVLSYGYDSRNRVATITHALGNAKFTYDAAGNLVRKLYSDGTDLNYTYDDNNRLTGGTGVTLVRDANGRIINSNGLAIGRDASGRITSITYPPGKVTYSYNNRGLLSQMVDWKGAATIFTYDAAGRRSTISRANGVVTQYSYDADGRLSGITETGPAPAPGGRAQRTEGVTLSRVAYVYSATGQLLEANNSDQSPPIAPGFQQFIFLANQTGQGDALGRRTADSVSQYGYDLASRLRSFQLPGTSASITYDAIGGLTSIASGGRLTTLTELNGMAGVPLPAVETNGSNSDFNIFLPDGEPFARVSNNITRYLHFDDGDNTTRLTGENGNVSDTYQYEPIGGLVQHTGPTQIPFTFGGRRGVITLPGSALYHVSPEVDYDPSTNQILASRDPLSRGFGDVNSYFPDELFEDSGQDDYPFAESVSSILRLQRGCPFVNLGPRFVIPAAPANQDDRYFRSLRAEEFPRHFPHILSAKDTTENDPDIFLDRGIQPIGIRPPGLNPDLFLGFGEQAVNGRFIGNAPDSPRDFPSFGFPARAVAPAVVPAPLPQQVDFTEAFFQALGGGTFVRKVGGARR